ncbi:hypothetical protein KAR91_52415 [Candidatus Pacearchaeota archaeon]|nr:hypothetical protein [Candidatus Pacearchaeota archaeon]
MESKSVNGRVCYQDNCSTCGKDRGFVPKARLGKNCKACAISISKKGKPSPKKGIKTGKPAHNRGKYFGNQTKKQVRSNISRRLRHCIDKKKVHIFDIVGYSAEDLVKHLESQFQDNMTWDNYGRKPGIECWEMDHITPESWFNYSSFEDDDFKKCWALNNLQPKWAYDNRSKGNRYSEVESA